MANLFGSRYARGAFLVVSLLLATVVPGRTAAATGAGVPAQIRSLTVRSDVSALTVSVTAPADNGSPIIRYVATCTGGGTSLSAVSVTPRLTVTNAVNNAFYSCSAHATNAIGDGPESYVRPGMPGLNYTKTTFTYCSPGGTPLLMDLLRPTSAAPVPVVMSVHGGGWYSGSRNLDRSMLATLLTSRGFAVATVDYRLAPAVNPAQQVEDIACAVRFMRGHAAELGITTSKLGAIGSSAGGNLVSLLGVHPPKASPGDEWAGQSDKVQAVVDEFGITEFGPDQMKIMPELYTLFGTHDQTVIDGYGPVKYVTSDDAPFFILHGVLDTAVPVHESQDFYNLLQAAHVPSTYVPIQHMGHSFQPVGANPSPSLVTVNTNVVRFLEQYLK